MCCFKIFFIAYGPWCSHGFSALSFEIRKILEKLGYLIKIKQEYKYSLRTNHSCQPLVIWQLNIGKEDQTFTGPLRQAILIDFDSVLEKLAELDIFSIPGLVQEIEHHYIILVDEHGNRKDYDLGVILTADIKSIENYNP